MNIMKMNLKKKVAIGTAITFGLTASFLVKPLYIEGAIKDQKNDKNFEKIAGEASINNNNYNNNSQNIEKMFKKTFVEVRFDDKIKELEEIIEKNYSVLKDSETSILYFKIGSLFYQKWNEYSKSDNDLKDSIKNYTRAIEKDKNNVSFLKKRALVYEDSGRLDEAIEDYTRVIELEPSFWHYLYRADVYQRKGETKKAKEDCKKARDISNK